MTQNLENVEDIYPLTPMQRLMLMHSLRSLGASTLINQFRYQLRGPLDQPRFKRAWEQVVSRHQALRTAFIWDGVPEPLQVVRTRVCVPLQFIDLRHLAESERSSRTEEILNSDRSQGFDLQQAPLLRLKVLRLNDEGYLLIFSRHHLILDLWSAEIVFDELFRSYRSNDGVIQQPAGRFRNYLDWLVQQQVGQAEAYWRRYFEGIEAPSLLFGARPQRNRWNAAGQSSIKQRIDAATAAAVRANAQQLGLTTSTLLQGVIALIVSVATGRRDVVFGLTVSSRPAEVDDVEHIVGSFINNIPLRSQIVEAMPIQQWLQQMQTAQAERAHFDHVSPIDLQRWSNLGANTALFDLLVLLQPPPAGKITVDDIEIEAIPGPLDSALPMTLAIEFGPQAWVLTTVYDCAIVSDQLAEGIVETLANTISTVAAGVPEHVGALRQSIAALLPNQLFPRQTATQPKAKTRRLARHSNGESKEAEIMLDIFRRAVGTPDVGLDDDFFALGGTSIQAAMAFTEIEQQFGRAMPLSTLFYASSVRDLMQKLELPPAPSTSLVSIQGFGDRPPIICISGIFGNVVGLANLARELGQDQPFFGLQSKALQGDQLPLNKIEAIAEQYIDECEPLLRGPYILFGVCFGANVAIEMAHQLNKLGQAPTLVVALDPSFHQEHNSEVVTAPSSSSALGIVLERSREWWLTFWGMQGKERRQWLQQKWHILFEKLRHRDLMHGNRLELAQQRVHAANLTAFHCYRPKPYNGTIHTLISRDRPVDPRNDPRIRWCKGTNSAPPIPVPGIDTGEALDHNAPTVAAYFRRWIDEIDGHSNEQPEPLTQSVTDHSASEVIPNQLATSEPP
ncbi:MAG: condensation domain-containing protein [Motiliproteus sp.]